LICGRRIVCVSLGTVLTLEQDYPGSIGSEITGKQLCRAVYRAVFTVLGNKYDFEKEDSGNKYDKKKLPLIIVSSGS